MSSQTHDSVAPHESLDQAVPALMEPPVDSRMDPVEMALINNRLEGIIRTMVMTVLRTARSGVIAVGKDFSCVVVTAGDELLASADSLPIHFFQGPDLQSKTMKEFHPEFKRGDAFIHNSPYHGNSHPHDWSILVPVFDADDVHRFTVVVKAHLADVGNAYPMRGVRDVYEEGPLVFPCVRVQDDYNYIDDIVRMCMLRIRVPEMWHGDFQALVGAARVGERQLVDLLNEFGADTVNDFIGSWFDYSELRMAQELAKVPAGSVTTTTDHDPLPGFPDGLPITTTVSTDPEARRATIDLRDNIDCQPFGYNLTEATARSAALTGMFSSLKIAVPINAGSFRRIDVLLRENCIVGIPRHPASCYLATTHFAETVSIGVATAMAEIADGFGLAEAGRMMAGSIAGVMGVDPRPGRGAFVDMLVLQNTLGPASSSADGWPSFGAMGVAGAAMHDSVEVDELKHPLIVLEERLVADSEGAGRFRGAPSAQVSYRAIPGATFTALYDCDGVVTPAKGVRGGGDGGVAAHFKVFPDGRRVVLGGVEEVVLTGGEALIAVCSAGGGYGRPIDRDSHRVLADVREGWVSRERARNVYGVAITDGLTIDEEETEHLRMQIEEGQLS